MNRRFAIATVGCKTNQFESASISRQLLDHGFLQVPFDQPADIYIVNSCTVTARADADTRRLVRRCSQRNPSAMVILTGCFAQVARHDAERLPGVTVVVPNDEKGIIQRLIEPSQHHTPESSTPSEFLPLEIQSDRTRAVIRIQTGCDAFCSYCIVPYARGKSRSVPLPEIIEGIRTLAPHYQEIVLTGIHIGMYGKDLPGPVTLCDLLQEIEQTAPSVRIRLGSIEPLEFDERLIRHLATSKRIAPHLHIPVQSGSAEILSAMKRGYGPTEISNLFSRLKNEIPNLTIGIDLIAGFPGETENHFHETLRFLENLPFDYAHVFPYSRRKGTAADTMPGHLHPAVIAQRSTIIREIAEQKRDHWMARWIGMNDTVLLLDAENDRLIKGITPSYLPVTLDARSIESRSEILCRFTSRNGNRLIAEVIETSG